MRAIFGRPDDPSSAYILVLRGIDEDSVRYFEAHMRKYPTWGCLLFPEYEQTDYDARPPFYRTRVHCYYLDLRYSRETDSEILMEVNKYFPPYSDEDPLVEETAPKVETPPLMVSRLDKPDTIRICNELPFHRHRISPPEMADFTERLKREVLKQVLENPAYWVVSVCYTERGTKIDVKLEVCRHELVSMSKKE